MQPLSCCLVQLKKLTKLISRHSRSLFLLLLLVVIVLVITNLSSGMNSIFFEELLSISHHIFIIFIVIRAIRWRWRLWYLNIVLDNLISENNTLIWSPDPRCLRFYLQWRHVKLLKNSLLKFRNNIWLFNMRKAEEDFCYCWNSEVQVNLRKYGTKSVLYWKRHDLSNLFRNSSSFLIFFELKSKRSQ